jgi:hypothetical protein
MAFTNNNLTSELTKATMFDNWEHKTYKIINANPDHGFALDDKIRLIEKRSINSKVFKAKHVDKLDCDFIERPFIIAIEIEQVI